MSRVEGRLVVLSPQQLRLHRALEELGCVDVIGELNEATRLTNPSATEPVLVTTNGTILAGIGRWRSAVFDGKHEINCIEYHLSDSEALQFIIRHHQPQGGWNAFTRIRLALTLEPDLQQRALDNMRAGGKYKGSASLPEAQHIDVCQEIARVAGVGARNVRSARTILEVAPPQLIDALGNSTLTINRAIQFCKLPQGRAVGALHPLQRGTRNQQGDPSIYLSAQRGKDQPRRCHSTRCLAASGGATTWIGCGTCRSA